eukprot:m.14704 g.14704  ORF g.14704 m.14704 type:complete len:144 (-) comp10331_c0_seq1:110-541(-)
MIRVVCVLLLLHATLCIAAVASDRPHVTLDDDGRLHFVTDDVVMSNISIKEMYNTVLTMTTMLQEEQAKSEQQARHIQQLSQQIRACTTPPFDGTRMVKLVASDAEEGDQFGYSVAATGSMVVVGAYSDDVTGLNSGSVYVFA